MCTANPYSIAVVRTLPLIRLYKQNNRRKAIIDSALPRLEVTAVKGLNSQNMQAISCLD